jgi:hypothetical protein
MVLAIFLQASLVQPAWASGGHEEEAPKPTTQTFTLGALLATIIFEGRPMGLLTVVSEITIEPDLLKEFQMRRFTMQDRFVLAIGNFATTGFDPRGKVDIIRLKRLLQVEMDRLMGPGKGTVYITAAYIAKRT